MDGFDWTALATGMGGCVGSHGLPVWMAAIGRQGLPVWAVAIGKHGPSV